MRALMYEQFQGALTIQNVVDPRPTAGGIVVKVLATGLCRSDWHGWMGHDPDIELITAFRYAEMLTMIKQGRLQPEKLIEKTITLEDAITALPDMNNFKNKGVLVINTF